MRDFNRWSFSLGRWAGLTVRLHVSFVLLAVFLLHWSQTRGQPLPLWYAWTLVGVWFASVLCRELVRVYAMLRFGGHEDRLLLWPLGSLWTCPDPRQAHASLMAALTGPLVHLSLAAAVWPALWVQQQTGWHLLNPLSMPVAASWFGCLQFVFWLNWTLALVNLLPAVPLDMGRGLVAALTLSINSRAAHVLSLRVAQFTGLGLWVAAWFTHRAGEPTIACLAILLGVVVFFGWQDESRRRMDSPADDGPFGYDFSQGYTSLERDHDTPVQTKPNPVRRWLEDRREARVQRQRQLEAEEEQRVDGVLARLHLCGLEGLSADERALLDRVSARYRNRPKQ